MKIKNILSAIALTVGSFAITNNVYADQTGTCTAGTQYCEESTTTTNNTTTTTGTNTNNNTNTNNAKYEYYQ